MYYTKINVILSKSLISYLILLIFHISFINKGKQNLNITNETCNLELEMQKEDLKSINRRLDTIIAILLNQTAFQEKTLKEKIQQLVSFGYDNNEIANMLGTTYSMVAKERSLKKRGRTNE